MPDIRSTIEIVDEFSQPLKDLASETLNAMTGTKALVDALTRESDALKKAKKNQEEYKKQLKFLKEEYFSFSKVAEGVLNIAKNAYGVLSGMFGEMKSVVETAMEDIEITDKMNALWDGAGKVAKERAYKLASELGQSQRMVTGLAAKAAFEGIGTADFERMMRLADRVAKLKPGETTEGAANSLLDNIKRGHDAGSIASLLGGGQKMERDLRRSGYERALRRGDVSGALEIAEKIAKQAGLTDERYKKASNSLSQNYARIGNTLDNVKQRLREIMSRYLEPIVQKVADILESEKFQHVANIVEGVAKRAMSIVSGLFGFISDNIYGIGVALGTVFVVSKIGPFFGMVTKLIPALLSIKKGIVAVGAAMKLAFLANPVGIVITAMVGLGYAIAKITGKVESLGGALSALAQICKNLFHDIGIIANSIADGGDRIKQFKRESEEYKEKYNSLLSKRDELKEARAVLAKGLDSGEISEAKYRELNIKYLQDLVKVNQDIQAVSKEWDESIKNFKEGSMSNKLKGMDGVAEAAKKTNEDFVNDLLGGIDNIINKKERREQQRHNFFMSWAKEQSWMSKQMAALQGGIETNTDKIREYNEREEELRWLKTFSDRQIMSAITNTTSNVQNNTFNRMSDAAYIERTRNISSRSSRPKFGSQG